MRKIRIGILFGGQSAEHEVSIQSAKNIFAAIDKTKYEVVLIGISKKGKWFEFSQEEFNKLADQRYQSLDKITEFSLLKAKEKSSLITTQDNNFYFPQNLDVVFPILHGPYGEDGTVQGLLKLLHIPFVGASVLGSAVAMDKDVTKRLLRDANLPVVRFKVVHVRERFDLRLRAIKEEIGIPFFVKPANLGSSVGVTKVNKMSEFEKALDQAFCYDRKILIEEAINAREIECSVLGNEEKIASQPGEIIPTHEFYDYEAKYLDENGARFEIPAKISYKQIKTIQELAIRACNVLCIEGMARVDFFLEKKTEKIYINEINTLPGFTNISMYPKLWEASGIPYVDLIDHLIRLALERHSKEQVLKTNR